MHYTAGEIILNVLQYLMSLLRDAKWNANVKKKNRGKKESMGILAKEQKNVFYFCLCGGQTNIKIFMSI